MNVAPVVDDRTDGCEHAAIDDVLDVDTSGVRWRVVRRGSGPVVLLLHGMGASKHSFGTLLPHLESDFTLVVPDLPGHSDSEALNRHVMSLSGMAVATARMLRALKIAPRLVVGHSAGAALGIRMALDGLIHPAGIVSINGAFMTYGGAIGRFLAPLAGLCSNSRFVTDTLARKARDVRAVERVIASTGSKLDRDAVSRYSKILQKPSHMAATFAMMANWDLTTLRFDIRQLSVPLTLLVAERDGAVDPSQAERVARSCSQAVVQRLPGLGHVAHEEDPTLIAKLVSKQAKALGLG